MILEPVIMEYKRQKWASIIIDCFVTFQYRGMHYLDFLLYLNPLNVAEIKHSC